MNAGLQLSVMEGLLLPILIVNAMEGLLLPILIVNAFTIRMGSNNPSITLVNSRKFFIASSSRFDRLLISSVNCCYPF